MPASFNPNVKLKEAPQAFMAQSVSQKRSVSGTSEARASYAVQTQGGLRLSQALVCGDRNKLSPR